MPSALTSSSRTLLTCGFSISLATGRQPMAIAPLRNTRSQSPLRVLVDLDRINVVVENSSMLHPV